MPDHIRHVGDTRTALAAALKYRGDAGLAAVDLTGLTVKFKMVNAATDVEKIAETSTGVTVTNAATGLVQYDFSAAGVDEPGKFYGYFVVYDAGESDHYPVEPEHLVIWFNGDSQSAADAYEEDLQG